MFDSLSCQALDTIMILCYFSHPWGVQLHLCLLPCPSLVYLLNLSWDPHLVQPGQQVRQQEASTWVHHQGRHLDLAVKATTNLLCHNLCLDRPPVLPQHRLQDLQAQDTLNQDQDRDTLSLSLVRILSTVWLGISTK